MIRQAKQTDAPEIEALIRRQYEASRFAGIVDIAPKALSQLVEGAIASQNQRGPQGTLVSVVEREGKLAGFIMGSLARIYHIGNKLEAIDIFFVNEGMPSDAIRLLDSYIAWASEIRAVFEIKLSWSDALEGAERVADLYRRKGFVKMGEAFRLVRDGGEQ